MEKNVGTFCNNCRQVVCICEPVVVCFFKKAIDKITDMRVNAIRNGHETLERELYDLEQLIFKAQDQQSLTPIFPFKERREKSGLTLREVEEQTGISNAYLSQLENGKIKKPSYNTVETLDKLYKKHNC